MRKQFTLVALLAVVSALPLTAQAHRGWILPAETVLSKENAWVTFDAGISNGIFHADHAAMRPNGISVTAPDGSATEVQNAHVGKLRSTFDVQLTQKGTYRIYTASNGLSARWETEEGERRMWPARGAAFTQESFDKEVPKKAQNLQITQNSRRLETFVTSGTPSKEVLKTPGVGLELLPITHPNYLYAGEAAKFQFLIDGKPAVGVKIEVIAGGMRYRNSQNEMTLETDKNGNVSIVWPHAGVYWLSASYRDDKAKKPATSRSGSYVATFEVLPQ